MADISAFRIEIYFFSFSCLSPGPAGDTIDYNVTSDLFCFFALRSLLFNFCFCRFSASQRLLNVLDLLADSELFVFFSSFLIPSLGRTEYLFKNSKYENHKERHKAS